MAQLKIAGMTCDSCTAHVKEALENVSGVRSVEVSYAKGSARLVIDADASPDALIAAVAGLGYRAALAIRHRMIVAELADQIFPYLTMVEGLKLAAQTFTRNVKQLSCCAG